MPRQRPAPSPHRRGTLIVAGEGVGDDGTGAEAMFAACANAAESSALALQGVPG